MGTSDTSNAAVWAGFLSPEPLAIPPVQFQFELATVRGNRTAAMVMSSQPEQLESAEKLPDGTVIRLRSVRPEDERLLHDLAAHMSPEDMRLRFLAAMRG